MPKKKKQTASKKEKQTTSKETPKKKAPTKTKEKTPKKFECKLCKNPESLKPIIKIVGTVLIIVASLAFVDLLVQYINNDYSIAVAVSYTHLDVYKRQEWSGCIKYIKGY